MKYLITLLLLTGVSTLCAQPSAPDPWETYFEASGGLRTPRYDSTLAYCRRLAAFSPLVHVTSFGQSAQGRALPLVIVSGERSFTAASARQAGKAVVLIQAGIHAGEIDGKDAGLMLIRDIVVRKQYPRLLDSLVLLFVPIFNVDGHERFGPYNRINQNGPVEMGWRTTAQNLNLNRDYMKADTPEMRALLKLFAAWLPDLYIDCHVTDGIDFQYDVTYTMDLGANIDAAVSGWAREWFLPVVLPAVEASGHKVFWYVMPREDVDLSKGLRGGGVSTPRFSTGYAALQNRPALLIETHSLKPYRTRVSATYQFLKASLQAVRNSVYRLRDVVHAADSYLESDDLPARTIPLRFAPAPGFHVRHFLGIKQRVEQSPLSGGTRIVYTGEPVELDLPVYDEMIAEDSVSVPEAYVVPPELTFLPELLRLHGIRYTQLPRADTLAITSYRFSDVQFAGKPYEGRQTVALKAAPVHERRYFPAGSLLISTRQRSAKVLVHLLEPRSPDSFVAWGFMNGIFEQKEYAEGYVMEKAGAEMLARRPDLRQAFEERVRTDSAFASNPDARLNWLYQHSPWSDSTAGVYPVGRLQSREK
jgi:hypothetical protein